MRKLKAFHREVLDAIGKQSEVDSSRLHQDFSAGRASVTLADVHAALDDLKERGLILTRFASASPEPGGRRRLCSAITAAGRRCLNEAA